MADEFDKLVYVLSTVSHVRDHAPLKPVIESSSERKNIDLLDGIALALTTRAKGDVTAVTMKQSATAIEFFYSKNPPCNGSLDVYLQAIKEAIANNNEIEVIQIEILKASTNSRIGQLNVKRRQNLAIMSLPAKTTARRKICATPSRGGMGSVPRQSLQIFSMIYVTWILVDKP